MTDARATLEAAVAAFPGKVRPVDDLRGEPAYVVDREAARDFVARLKESGFHFLVLVTGVDNYLSEPRFEVVYVLRSLEANLDVRLNVPVPGEDARADSVVELFPAANWMEREVYDMFGVRFDGHPNLERILMWEGFDGWPLRKDYPLLGNSPGTPGYVGKGGRA